jgi:hypothetical protein
LPFKIKKKEKRAEELVKTKEQAEESDRLKLAFLANMTQRLEQMNGILGLQNFCKNHS